MLKDIPPRMVACLKCKGPWRQLPEMLVKLEEHLAKAGLEATGPACGVYYNTPAEAGGEELVWDVFRPVESRGAEASEDQSGFGIKMLPGTRVARAIHTGPYRRAGSTYERLEQWIREQELRLCGPAEEVYLSPLSSPLEEQRMEIRLPVCAL